MSGRSISGEIKGESERVIRDRDSQSKVTAGVNETQVSLDNASSVRECIEGGMCPVCGAGPFKSLGNHVPRIHGISARELRALAGMKVTDSIVSADYRAKRQRISKHQFESKVKAMREGHEKWRDEGNVTELSEAGRLARKSQLDQIRPKRPSDEHITKFTLAGRAASSERRRMDALKAVDLVETTDLTMKEIAGRIGHTPANLRRLLDSVEYKIDGRTRRWKKR